MWRMGTSPAMCAYLAGPPYRYVGCYQERPDRLLNTPLLELPSPSLTIEKCYEAAMQSGASVFGIQWGESCWVGNTLEAATSLGPAVCNSKCRGNQTQLCGDQWVNGIWEITQGWLGSHCAAMMYFAARLLNTCACSIVGTRLRTGRHAHRCTTLTAADGLMALPSNAVAWRR